MNVLVLVLALYFIEYGEAQKAQPRLLWSVKFPAELLPLAYVAAFLTVPNLALSLLTLLRRLWRRRWVWLTTVLAAAVLVPVVGTLGMHGVWAILNPAVGR